MQRISITAAILTTLPSIGMAHTDLHTDRGVTAYFISVGLAIVMGVAIWVSVQNRQ